MVADKSVVSLLGVEQEEDATALFSSVLGNQDGEGGEIYDCERAHWYHRINVCPHWICDVSSDLPSNRNNKNS